MENGRSETRARFVGAAGTLGTVAVVALMVLSGSVAAAAVSPAVFRGAIHQPALYKSVTGCGANSGKLPSWSHYTGVGKMKGSTSARTCSKASGISSFGSNSYVFSQIWIQAPVRLPTGNGGINITWDIAEKAITSGGITGTAVCPTTTTVSDVDLGFTWYNYTSVYAYCAAIGAFQIAGYAYLYDSTSGTWYYASNWWNTIYNTSGQYNYSWASVYTYSNASYWGYNFTSFGNYSNNFGASNTLSGTFVPTWFVNGTFNHSHRYVVYTYLDLFANSYVYSYPSGHATASVDMSSGGDHADLLPFSIW
jgi:hypothetical protein